MTAARLFEGILERRPSHAEGLGTADIIRLGGTITDEKEHHTKNRLHNDEQGGMLFDTTQKNEVADALSRVACITC